MSTVTALGLRYSTQNRSEPSFLRAKTIRLSHSVVAGLMTPYCNMPSNSVAANCRTLRLVGCGSLWRGWKSSRVGSIRCLAVFIQPEVAIRHIFEPLRSLKNSGQCCSYLSSIVTSSRQLRFRRSSLSC